MGAATRAELILVVDDSSANRYFFQDSLTEAGYRVGEATCGSEAFAFLEKEMPDSSCSTSTFPA